MSKKNKKLKFEFDFHMYQGGSKSIFLLDLHKDHVSIELFGMEVKIVWRFKKWLKKF